MSKTRSSGMTSHMGETTTAFAMCWELTRTDGKVFRFTNHDQDLRVDGFLYEASSGYNQTAITNDSSLSVDNLDVEGILDSDRISETDLRLGKFDYAAIKVFNVNWKDLSIGKLKQRSGYIGEVTVTNSGVFKAEIRGLTQQYAQKIVEVYTPDCRVDLGSTKCGISIEPDEVERNTAYSVGDTVKVATNPTVGRVIGLGITNPSFDTGDLTGWDTVTGTPETHNGASVVIDPFDGGYYLRGSSGTGDYELKQDIDVTAHATAIDAGNLKLFFNARLSHTGLSGSPFDTNEIIIEAYDVSSVYISDIFNEPAATVPVINRWYKRGDNYLEVPANTRSIRIRLKGVATVDTTCRAVFDDVKGHLLDITDKREQYSDLLLNSDFEFGNNTNWTATQGTFNTDNSEGGLTPNSGQFFYRPLSESLVDVYNDLDFTTDIEINTTDVDNEFYYADLSYFVAKTVDENDLTRVRVECLNSTGGNISTPYDHYWYGDFIDSEDTWYEQEASFLIPANTRKIRVRLISQALVGGTPNVVLDDIQLGLRRDPPTEGYEIYENKMYNCTTAGTTDRYVQPAYDTTVGNTTTDGTAVFTAEESWMRSGVVASVTDNQTFTVTLTESRAVDDWFNGGALKWITGNNIGVTMEVKDWIQSSSTVTLFLAMPFTIQTGDKFKMYPGCNKTSTVCINKFDNITNFRGEPYVPGEDKLRQRPNAR